MVVCCGCSFRHIDIFVQLGLQLVNQCRFHVAVVVWDIRADDLLPVQSFAELLRQHAGVLLCSSDPLPAIPTADLAARPASEEAGCRVYHVSFK